MFKGEWIQNDEQQNSEITKERKTKRAPKMIVEGPCLSESVSEGKGDL